MTPGTPPAPGLFNATQPMRRLEAILACGTKLRPNPTDQASRPAKYYPSVMLSSKVYILPSTQPSGRCLTKPPGGGDVGDSSRQC